jgi:hypothetical protein
MERLAHIAKGEAEASPETEAGEQPAPAPPPEATAAEEGHPAETGQES